MSEPVLYVCRHEDPPRLVRPNYRCSDGGDEPVHAEDTVTTTTVTRAEEVGGVLRFVETTSVKVSRD